MSSGILLLTIAAIVVVSIRYLLRAKKSGNTCIGCPNGGQCNNGCRCHH